MRTRIASAFLASLFLVTSCGLHSPIAEAQAEASPAAAIARELLIAALRPGEARLRQFIWRNLSPNGRTVFRALARSSPHFLGSHGVERAADLTIRSAGRMLRFAGHYFEEHVARHYGSRWGTLRFARANAPHADLIAGGHRIQVTQGSMRLAIEKGLLSDRYATRVLVPKDVAARIHRVSRFLARYDRRLLPPGRLERLARLVLGEIQIQRGRWIIVIRFGRDAVKLGWVRADGTFVANRRVLQQLGIKFEGAALTRAQVRGGARAGLQEIRGLSRALFGASRVVAVLGAVGGIASLAWTVGEAWSEGGMAAVGDHAGDIAVLAFDAGVGIATLLGAELSVPGVGWVAFGVTALWFGGTEVLSYRDRVYFERHRIELLIRLHEAELH